MDKTLYDYVKKLYDKSDEYGKRAIMDLVQRTLDKLIVEHENFGGRK